MNVSPAGHVINSSSMRLSGFYSAHGRRTACPPLARLAEALHLTTEEGDDSLAPMSRLSARPMFGLWNALVSPLRSDLPNAGASAKILPGDRTGNAYIRHTCAELAPRREGRVGDRSLSARRRVRDAEDKHAVPAAGRPQGAASRSCSRRTDLRIPSVVTTTTITTARTETDRAPATTSGSSV